MLFYIPTKYCQGLCDLHISLNTFCKTTQITSPTYSIYLPNIIKIFARAFELQNRYKITAKLTCHSLLKPRADCSAESEKITKYLQNPTHIVQLMHGKSTAYYI